MTESPDLVAHDDASSACVGCRSIERGPYEISVVCREGSLPTGFVASRPRRL